VVVVSAGVTPVLTVHNAQLS